MDLLSSKPTWSQSDFQDSQNYREILKNKQGGGTLKLQNWDYAAELLQIFP